MGYTTDIIGHAEVDPPLNVAEADYLAAFAESRRWQRPGGPYVVPPHPLLDEPKPDLEVDDSYNWPHGGQPSLWCHWVPAGRGRLLAYDGHEKFYAPADWMRYLIDHFLAPGAEASRSGDPAFDQFTFDHHVDGMLAARRRDSGRLWLIRVVDNVVEEEPFVAGDPRVEFGPLLYEDEIDRTQVERRRRRSAPV